MADGRYAPMLPPSPPPGLSHSLCFDSCDLTDQVGRMDASLFNGARCSIGQGVVLDGRDDFVELADAPQGGAMSLAMWLKLDTLTQATAATLTITLILTLTLSLTLTLILTLAQTLTF